MARRKHLQDDLAETAVSVTVETRHGPVVGGRAANGAAVFLEIPYALPPRRFEDPQSLPESYRYERREYIKETAYGAQPNNDGQARGVPSADKLGYGKPTENPLFLNIVIPPGFPQKRKFLVKVYIHGGFLQFGSPHSVGSQAQYIAAERDEIWVNIGYRLSAFGFLASDRPALSGNYGFKDQWLALEWIKDNIESFGGNSDDIQITGLSAGAHSVHQILHHASHLPEGTLAPFNSAILQSNAILVDPKTPAELRPQFEAFCRALQLDPNSPDTLTILKDPAKLSWQDITLIIENEEVLGPLGTFRGALSPDWISVSPCPMEWQRSGGLARGLKAHGVRNVVIGDLTEEWYLYSIAHPIHSPRNILPNLERYFPTEFSKRLIASFPHLPPTATKKQAQRLYGDIMSCAQVHLPVRVFARDLARHGFPVLRYEIRWTPEQLRPRGGYVTHGGDRVLWALRVPSLNASQVPIARAWLDRIREETDALTTSQDAGSITRILTLREDKTIDWTEDTRWEEMSRLEKLLDERNPRSKL